MHKILKTCLITMVSFPLSSFSQTREEAESKVMKTETHLPISPEADEKKVKDLVAQLGSNIFLEREEAQKNLLNLDVSAIKSKSFEAGLASGDPEISRRADSIFHNITRPYRTVSQSQLLQFIGSEVISSDDLSIVNKAMIAFTTNVDAVEFSESLKKKELFDRSYIEIRNYFITSEAPKTLVPPFVIDKFIKAREDYYSLFFPILDRAGFEIMGVIDEDYAFDRNLSKNKSPVETMGKVGGKRVIAKFDGEILSIYMIRSDNRIIITKLRHQNERFKTSFVKIQPKSLRFFQGKKIDFLKVLPDGVEPILTKEDIKILILAECKYEIFADVKKLASSAVQNLFAFNPSQDDDFFDQVLSRYHLHELKSSIYTLLKLKLFKLEAIKNLEIVFPELKD